MQKVRRVHDLPVSWEGRYESQGVGDYVQKFADGRTGEVVHVAIGPADGKEESYVDELLRNRGLEVQSIGVDQKHYGAKNELNHFVMGMAQNIPVRENSVDLVTIINVASNIDVGEVEKTLSNIHTILRPDGKAIIDMPRKYFQNTDIGSNESSEKVATLSIQRKDIPYYISQLRKHRLELARDRKARERLEYIRNGRF